MGYVSDNYKEVEARVAAACARAGRARESVTLIAVSKTKPVEDIRELIEVGVVDFGENKVQEMCSKMEAIPEELHWHLIGHLQRNKVKFIAGSTHLIHSVDSMRLAQEIQKEAAKVGRVCPVLIEVNIGNEESKDGVPYEEAEALVRQVSTLANVKICGLMCIAPFTDEPESNRGYFKQMRALRDRIAEEALPGVEMRELSMGMTGDFEVAIEEGATMVRVGTAIFGHRDYGTAQ